MPQPGGVASGFKHVEVNEQEHETRLYVCTGNRVVHVKEASYLDNCFLLQKGAFYSCLDQTFYSITRFLLLDRP